MINKALELASHLMINLLNDWRLDKRNYNDNFVRFLGSQKKLIILHINWRDTKKIKAFRAVKSKNNNAGFIKIGHSINFSINRTPQAHAQEIKRRLIKGFDSLYNDYMTKKKIYDLKKDREKWRLDSFLFANKKLKLSDLNHHHSGYTCVLKNDIKTDINLNVNLTENLHTKNFKELKRENIINLNLKNLKEDLAQKILNLICETIEEKKNDKQDRKSYIQKPKH